MKRSPSALSRSVLSSPHDRPAQRSRRGRGARAARPKVPKGPLSAEELRLIHAWWRAANYLSVGQIYLLENPLLTRPLTRDHVKPRLLGHWGTTPGLTFL